VAKGPKDEVHKRLVIQVRAAAKVRGVQLTHVPDLAGVSRSHFWDVLAGRKSPTVSWLTKVAVALDYEPHDLLGGIGLAPPLAIITRKGKKVPLVSMRAAAGAFSEPESVEPAGFINASTRRVIKPGMFAAAVSGRSMEPLIRDGSICLFRPGVKVLEDKVLLLQLRDARDPESGGRYTVKRFKAAGRSGERVTKVRLEPINRSFRPIVLEEDPMRQLTVIAEFLEVLVQADR
jgi:SOS-response transcriptional repressor LexA